MPLEPPANQGTKPTSSGPGSQYAIMTWWQSCADRRKTSGRRRSTIFPWIPEERENIFSSEIPLREELANTLDEYRETLRDASLGAPMPLQGDPALKRLRSLGYIE